MSISRYLKIYLGVILGGLALVASWCFAVDPYVTFRWHDIPGFNDQKTLKRDGGRINKALILKNTQFDVLFFGSSTSETGLDPQSAALNGQSAFNASLAYTSLQELHKMALFAADHQQPKLVIIGLDLVNFQDIPPLTSEISDQTFSSVNMAALLTKRLLFQKAFEDSFGVWLASRKHLAAQFPKFGNYNPGGGSKHRASETLRKFKESLVKRTFVDFRYDPNNTALLAEIVDRFRAKGSQVILYIPPYHVLHSYAIAQSGAGPAWQRLKQDLAELVQQTNQSPGQPVHLWDFSSVSAITSEPLPASDGEAMRGYWDSIHYTAAVGDLILARILDQPQAPADFGFEVTGQTLDRALSPTQPPAYFAAEMEQIRAGVGSGLIPQSEPPPHCGPRSAPHSRCGRQPRYP